MNDLLVLVIVVAVVANVALIVGAIVYGRTRRQPERATAPEGPPRPVEGFASAPPSVPVTAPTAPVSLPVDRPADATARDLGGEASGPGLAGAPAAEADRAAASTEPPPPQGLVDPLTGVTTLAGWEQVLVHEENRYGRYGRPATVVAIELDRLTDLADRLGDETADRLIPAVAETIRRSSRAADVVARTGHATFGVLMPETDEIRAINFVERIRESCDTWLEASAVAVRLAIGWASAGPGSDLRTAARIATERMYADRDRGRPAPGRPPSVAT